MVDKIKQSGNLGQLSFNLMDAHVHVTNTQCTIYTVGHRTNFTQWPII